MDFERLFNRHKDAVYRQLVRVCHGNHTDAEDALAEAILAAYRASDQLRDEASYRAWITQIGARVCMRMRKQEKLGPVLELVEGDLTARDPHEHLQQGEMKSCILEAIQKLPESYREVYVRREVGGQSASEVAEALGITVATVKIRLHRARLIVRDMLDKSVCMAS